MGTILKPGQQPVLLVLGRLPDPYEALLQENFSCLVALTHADVAAIVAEHAAWIEGVVLINELGVRRDLIAALPALRMIANYGAGYDDIDLAAAAAHGIVIANTPDVTTEEVADVAMALLIMAVRNLNAAERFLRAQQWTQTESFPLSISTLRNRRLGIFGYGRIGRAVERRARGFGLEVSYHSRRRASDSAAHYFESLTALAAHVDTLMICVGGGADTFHCVDSDVLGLLGPNGIVVNVGRGSVIDTAALVEHLEQRWIMAAALDVHEGEPEVAPALLALDNVVLTPHLASGSQHTHRMMGKLTYENVMSYFHTGTLLTPIKELSGKG